MEQKIGQILSDFSFPNFVGVGLDWILMLIYLIGIYVNLSDRNRSLEKHSPLIPSLASASEIGKTRSRIGTEVWRFLSDSKWSRSAFFVYLLESEWSRSLESNFKIEIKNDTSVNYDFDVTALVSQSLKSIPSWSGVVVRKKRLRPFLVVDYRTSPTRC